MKKSLILFAFIAMVSIGANAQYTPSKGDLSFEVQFSPFKSDGTVFSMNGVQGKYFTGTSAIRFGLDLNLGSNDNGVQTTTTGIVGFNGGYEKHFNLNNRLSLYVGPQVGVKFNINDTDWNDDQDDDDYDYYWAKTRGGYDNDSYEEENENDASKMTELNLACVAGADFYIYKGLYIGAEVQFGIDYEFYKKTSNLNVGFRANPSIRLGVTF